MVLWWCIFSACVSRALHVSVFFGHQHARMRPGRVTCHHSSAARHPDARGKGLPDARHVAVRDACVMHAPLACVMRA